jgi:hypothetical protein
MKTAKNAAAATPFITAPAVLKATKKATPTTGAKVAHLADPAKEKKSAPMNAMAAKYAPALKALVSSLVDVARTAQSAGLAVAERLAEAFAMDPHRTTGHDTPTAWAHALLTEACPMAGQSTVYAWIEAGVARAAVVAAGQDPSLFPMDTLRVIGSKSVAGQDPKRMAALAEELATTPTLRNGAGKVDPKKARAHVSGDAITSMDRKEKVQKLARTARKLGGNAGAAIDLLREAIAMIEKA